MGTAGLIAVYHDATDLFFVRSPTESSGVEATAENLLAERVAKNWNVAGQQRFLWHGCGNQHLAGLQSSLKCGVVQTTITKKICLVSCNSQASVTHRIPLPLPLISFSCFAFFGTTFRTALARKPSKHCLEDTGGKRQASSTSRLAPCLFGMVRPRRRRLPHSVLRVLRKSTISNKEQESH